MILNNEQRQFLRDLAVYYATKRSIQFNSNIINSKFDNPPYKYPNKTKGCFYSLTEALGVDERFYGIDISKFITDFENCLPQDNQFKHALNNYITYSKTFSVDDFASRLLPLRNSASNIQENSPLLIKPRTSCCNNDCFEAAFRWGLGILISSGYFYSALSKPFISGGINLFSVENGASNLKKDLMNLGVTRKNLKFFNWPNNTLNVINATGSVAIMTGISLYVLSRSFATYKGWRGFYKMSNKLSEMLSYLSNQITGNETFTDKLITMEISSVKELENKHFLNNTIIHLTNPNDFYLLFIPVMQISGEKPTFILIKGNEPENFSKNITIKSINNAQDYMSNNLGKNHILNQLAKQSGKAFETPDDVIQETLKLMQRTFFIDDGFKRFLFRLCSLGPLSGVLLDVTRGFLSSNSFINFFTSTTGQGYQYLRWPFGIMSSVGNFISNVNFQYQAGLWGIYEFMKRCYENGCCYNKRPKKAYLRFTQNENSYVFSVVVDGLAIFTSIIAAGISFTQFNSAIIGFFKLLLGASSLTAINPWIAWASVAMAPLLTLYWYFIVSHKLRSLINYLAAYCNKKQGNTESLKSDNCCSVGKKIALCITTVVLGTDLIIYNLTTTCYVASLVSYIKELKIPGIDNIIRWCRKNKTAKLYIIIGKYCFGIVASLFATIMTGAYSHFVSFSNMEKQLIKPKTE